MERHYVELTVYLKLPGGEAPGIDAEDKATEKVETAVNEILGAGVGANGFTLSAMDVAEDAAVGVVLTYDNA